jgi:hypothetical protein
MTNFLSLIPIVVFVGFLLIEAADGWAGNRMRRGNE